MFGTLFVLSQDYWTWDNVPVPGPLGLPRWVYLFAALQIGVTIAVAFYIRRESSDS